MEIRTNREREASNAKGLPQQDKARQLRRRGARKLVKVPIAARRFLPILKTLGKLGSFLLIAVFILSVFVYAYTSDRFSLQHVAFIGCKELDQKQLEQIVRQNSSTNILRIDLHRLKNRLEKETWAKSVEIRRVLPSDLMIHIQERIPCAIVEMRGELMLTDNEGILLDKYSPRYGKLDVPVFKGIQGDDLESFRTYQEENSARIRHALDMLSEIESGSPLYAHNISEIDISDKKNLKLMLVDDTVEVYLGEKDYLKRFRKLMDNLGRHQEMKNQYDDIAYVDLRFDSQIIWRLRRAMPDITRKSS